MNNPGSQNPDENDAMIQQAILNLSGGGQQDPVEIEKLQALIKELADKDPAVIANLISDWLREENS